MQTKEQKTYTPLSKLATYNSNPFIQQLIDSGVLEPKKKTERKDELFTSLESGEIISVPTGIKGTEYYFKDTRQFIKIFNCSDCFKQIANLTSPASYLFWSIVDEISNTPKGIKMQVRDTIILTYDKYKRFSETSSKASYYKAIVELVEKEFIAKLGSDSYYLNLNKFVNGDITKLIGNYLNAEDEYYKIHPRKI